MEENENVPEETKTFVLNYTTDPHALVALYAYAQSVKVENTELSTDLMSEVVKYRQLLLDTLPKTINPGEAKCHSCKNKRLVPGNTHISCSKPYLETKGDPHGIKNGWFYYPILFDPVWMITECKNFEDNENKLQ